VVDESELATFVMEIEHPTKQLLTVVVPAEQLLVELVVVEV
jgi:hypothetical protein